MPRQGDKYVYDYPRAGLTADVVLLDLVEGRLSVLMVKRAGEPYVGYWALPGGYMEIDETLEFAALRELREETGVEPRHIETLGVYDALDRDPRGRTLTFAYLAVGVRGGGSPAALHRSVASVGVQSSTSLHRVRTVRTCHAWSNWPRPPTRGQTPKKTLVFCSAARATTAATLWARPSAHGTQVPSAARSPRRR